jgi:hypothetical protein
MEIELQVLELTHGIPGQAACESRDCIWPLLAIHVHVGTAMSPMPHCLWRNRSSVLAVSREFIALGGVSAKGSTSTYMNEILTGFTSQRMDISVLLSKP